MLVEHEPGGEEIAVLIRATMRRAIIGADEVSQTDDDPGEHDRGQPGAAVWLAALGDPDGLIGDGVDRVGGPIVCRHRLGSRCERFDVYGCGHGLYRRTGHTGPLTIKRIGGGEYLLCTADAFLAAARRAGRCDGKVPVAAKKNSPLRGDAKNYSGDGGFSQCGQSFPRTRDCGNDLVARLGRGGGGGLAGVGDPGGRHSGYAGGAAGAKCPDRIRQHPVEA